MKATPVYFSKKPLPLDNYPIYDKDPPANPTESGQSPMEWVSKEDVEIFPETKPVKRESIDDDDDFMGN